MKILKKIVLKIPINQRYQDFFDMLIKYELLQIHRLDENFIYATQMLRFRNQNFNPKDLKGKLGIEFIEILVEDKPTNEIICFIKHRWNEEMHSFFTNSEIMIEPPIIMEGSSLIMTFISHGINVDTILDSMKQNYGNTFEILSINSVHPNNNNLKLLLTERQKEIIYYSVENGYYDIPRKIISNSIADHFGISKSAFCEHLRKIEKSIFLSIFK